MNVQINHYTELSNDDFHDLIALRIAVFVVEQNCPYQELDGKDKRAFHLFVRNDAGTLTGTLRILPPGVSYVEASIGRVASHPNHRHEKLGHLMMKTAMEYVRDHMMGAPVRISAQSHLCQFYEGYGFIKTGIEYLEDGIPHSEMLFNA